MSIGGRIKELRGEMARHDFADLFGVARNTIQRYENDERTPDSVFIAALCNHFKITVDWLISGEEPMHREALQPHPSLDYDYIPMVEAKLSAGGGSFVEAEGVQGYYAFRKDWLRRVATSVKDLVLMRVTGDSMTPNLQKNDTVLIDTNRKDIKEGEIYAIRYDYTIMVKRLAFRPGQKVLVISDNKTDFEPYEVAIQDLHVIGQVIFFSRSLIPEGI